MEETANLECTCYHSFGEQVWKDCPEHDPVLRIREIMSPALRASKGRGKRTMKYFDTLKAAITIDEFVDYADLSKLDEEDLIHLHELTWKLVQMAQKELDKRQSKE